MNADGSRSLGAQRPVAFALRAKGAEDFRIGATGAQNGHASAHPLRSETEGYRRFAPLRSAVLVLGILLFAGPASARPGTVTWSDGKKMTGDITTTPGKQLKLFTSGQPVELPLEECKSLRFTPEKENTEHGFYFPEAGQTAKKMTGDVYPTRYIHTAITLPDGKVIDGHLYTMVLYVQADDGSAQKAVLEAKQTGQDGQKVEDIPYITAIDFTDSAGGESTLDLSKENIPGAKAPVVVSKPDLSPVSLQPGAKPNTWTMPVPDPTQLFLSIQGSDGFHVAWPAQEVDPATLTDVQTGIKNMQDFYDARTLLGTTMDADSGDVYTLAMLTRKGAMVGGVAGEQRWSLVILHWKYDATHSKVNLANRAPLGIAQDGNTAPPPPVLKSAALLGDITGPQAAASPASTNSAPATTNAPTP